MANTSITSKETSMEKKDTDTRPLFEPAVTVVMTALWAISVVRIAVAVVHGEYLGAEVAVASLFVVVGLALAVARLVHKRRRS
jgi:hypothetical protein